MSRKWQRPFTKGKCAPTQYKDKHKQEKETHKLKNCNGHFRVICLVTLHVNASEAASELALLLSAFIV